ncbi:MAG: hypothetical protein ACLRVT_08465 [Oscillospiraceae bacterium]
MALGFLWNKTEFEIPVNRDEFAPIYKEGEKTIRVNQTGRISMSSDLLAQFENREVELSFHRTGRSLILDAKGETRVQFTKGCYITDKRVSEALERLGFILPAVYEVGYNSVAGVWYGVCTSQTPPPDPQEMAQKLPQKTATRGRPRKTPAIGDI